MQYDVAIIGAGIVGAAIAWELSKTRTKILLLEKENDVALGASRANSGIIHAGFDASPGSLMARFNVAGARLAKTLCQELDVPYKETGSLVLALRPEERKALESLKERGRQNGVRGLALLDRESLLAREANLSPAVLGGLYAPQSGVVSPWEYAIAFVEVALQNGVELRLESAVTAIRQAAAGFQLQTESGPVLARTVINAAGVYSDQVHNLLAAPTFSITPTRGEYFLFDVSAGQTVSQVIFQVPDEKGKGVLVAPTAHGNLIVGPNAEATTDREDTANRPEALASVRERALRSVPGLDFAASIRNFAGLRATSDRPDFIVEWAEQGFLDVAGIKSPGLTAAPALARHVRQLLADEERLGEEKSTWQGTRRQVRFKDLSAAAKIELLRRRPDYGRIVCRCQTVTEGEIVDSLSGPIPLLSLDAVKRRTTAGMGRCQGGFCAPRILELIARENRLDPLEVLQDRAGSQILTGRSKEKQTEGIQG